MTDKEKVIKELKETLDSLDITNKYRLNLIRAIEYLQEEPVSESLVEAAWQYYDRNKPPMPSEWNLHKEFIDFFKAGAQWGKNQTKVEIQAQSMALAHSCPKEPVSEDLEEAAELYTLDDSIKPWRNLTKEAFKAGAKWQKQQIMKDVVEVGEAHIVWVEDNGRAFPELDDSVNDMLMPGDISKHFKDGDKVWIYLTKEKLLYLEKDEEIKKVIIKE